MTIGGYNSIILGLTKQKKSSSTPSHSTPLIISDTNSPHHPFIISIPLLIFPLQFHRNSTTIPPQYSPYSITIPSPPLTPKSSKFARTTFPRKISFCIFSLFTKIPLLHNLTIVQFYSFSNFPQNSTSHISHFNSHSTLIYSPSTLTQLIFTSHLTLTQPL